MPVETPTKAPNKFTAPVPESPPAAEAPAPGVPEVLTATKTADSDPLYRILKACHWKAFAVGEFHRRSEFEPKIAFEVEDPISGSMVAHKDWRHLRTEDAREKQRQRMIDEAVQRLLQLKCIAQVII